jgi:hypothetical protein
MTRNTFPVVMSQQRVRVYTEANVSIVQNVGNCPI